MNKIYLYIILFFTSIFSYGQNEDYEKDLEMALRPSKATFYSAVLPGLGQAYNKKYWKVPIIYAGLIASAYYINDNHNQYKAYKKAYLIRIDNDPNTIDEYVGQYSSNDLIILKDLNGKEMLPVDQIFSILEF